MAEVTPIDRAIDLIEGNLMAAVTVADMAAAAGYSLFHFSRTFNQATHYTPYDYLMRRRLSEAAQTLVRTDRKIIDVAFDYQFNSPETFSRAFKRMFGTLPSQWRREGRVDPRHLMPRLTPAHLWNLRRGNGLKPTLVDLPPLQLTGLMTHIRDDPDAIPALWTLLERELSGQQPVDPLPGHYGVTFYPDTCDADRRAPLPGRRRPPGSRPWFYRLCRQGLPGSHLCSLHPRGPHPRPRSDLRLCLQHLAAQIGPCPCPPLCPGRLWIELAWRQPRTR